MIRKRQSKPQFNLDWKDKDKSKPKPIFLLYRYKVNPTTKKKDKPFKYSTGKQIHPKSWDVKNQFAVKGVRVTEKEAEDLNEFLYDLKKEVKDIVAQNPEISKDDLRKELNYFTLKEKRPKAKNETTLLEYCKIFIAQNENSERTIDKFNGVKNLIEEYQKENDEIKFSDLTSEFLRIFMKWYYKKYPKNSQNTILLLR